MKIWNAKTQRQSETSIWGWAETLSFSATFKQVPVPIWIERRFICKVQKTNTFFMGNALLLLINSARVIFTATNLATCHQKIAKLATFHTQKNAKLQFQILHQLPRYLLWCRHLDMIENMLNKLPLRRQHTMLPILWYITSKIGLFRYFMLFEIRARYLEWNLMTTYMFNSHFKKNFNLTRHFFLPVS